MAITFTGPSQTVAPQVAVGRIVATSTPVAISGFACGFSPRYIMVVNSSERVKLEWFDQMSAAQAIKTVAAGTVTKLTSLGITVGKTGFSIGLDTDLLVTHGVSDNQNILDYVAFG